MNSFERGDLGEIATKARAAHNFEESKAQKNKVQGHGLDDVHAEPNCSAKYHPVYHTLGLARCIAVNGSSFCIDCSKVSPSASEKIAAIHHEGCADNRVVALPSNGRWRLPPCTRPGSIAAWQKKKTQHRTRHWLPEC